MGSITPIAPIALFAYNRKDHLKQSIDSLLKNELAGKTDLFIYSDGPKNEKEISNVNAVRDYLKTINGFKSVNVIERLENFGLAKSIIAGVTEIVSKFNKIIVLEDDIVCSRLFLEYMNSYLDYYEKDEDVISIHGYIYPVKKKLPNTFFIRGADCWGWATWKRGWDLFQEDGKILIEELEKNNLMHAFDFEDTFSYSTMLREQIEGKNNSWAIRWNASAFINNKLTLYPGISLVQNIGNDSSGTHCGDNTYYFTEVNNEKLSLKKIPIIENIEAREILKEYFLELKNATTKEEKESQEKTNNFEDVDKKTILRKLKEKIPLPIKSKIKKFLKNETFPTAETLIPKPPFDEYQYGWNGDFNKWEDVLKISKSYSSETIIEKVKNSLLKVKSGEAVYERDSVLFDQKEYSWPLLASLMMVAAINNGNINVLDFGGSLGSSYFQNLEFLKKLKLFTWNIVEQSNFVIEGKIHFENETLKFYEKIEDVLNEKNIQLIIFSGVLQYLEDPYSFVINQILKLKIPYILIDLTGIINGERDRLTLQKVPPSIYEASYPCWFFNENKFLNMFLEKYRLIVSFPGFVGSELKLSDGTEVNYKGYFFELK